MSVANIASLAFAMETCFPWIWAKLAIFAADMLWESCSKFHSKHHPITDFDITLSV